MKQPFQIIILVICSIVPIPSSAYISKKLSAEEKLIYCPEQITCTKDKDIDSCTVEGNDKEYWNYLTNDGKIVKGVYKFDSAHSSYDVLSVNHTLQPGTCRYINATSNIDRYITLGNLYRIIPYTEAFLGKDTKWHVSGYEATCNGAQSNSHLCPMTEPYLVINFLFNGAGGLRLFVNSNELNFQRSGEVNYINYDMLLLACGSVKQCTVDAYYQLYGRDHIGTFTVDMDNLNVLQNSKEELIPETNQHPAFKAKMEKINPFKILKIEITGL